MLWCLHISKHRHLLIDSLLSLILCIHWLYTVLLHHRLLLHVERLLIRWSHHVLLPHYEWLLLHHGLLRSHHWLLHPRLLHSWLLLTHSHDVLRRWLWQWYAHHRLSVSHPSRILSHLHHLLLWVHQLLLCLGTQTHYWRWLLLGAHSRSIGASICVNYIFQAKFMHDSSAHLSDNSWLEIEFYIDCTNLLILMQYLDWFLANLLLCHLNKIKDSIANCIMLLDTLFIEDCQFHFCFIIDFKFKYFSIPVRHFTTFLVGCSTLSLTTYHYLHEGIHFPEQFGVSLKHPCIYLNRQGSRSNWHFFF